MSECRCKGECQAVSRVGSPHEVRKHVVGSPSVCAGPWAAVASVLARPGVVARGRRAVQPVVKEIRRAEGGNPVRLCGLPDVASGSPNQLARRTRMPQHCLARQKLSRHSHSSRCSRSCSRLNTRIPSLSLKSPTRHDQALHGRDVAHRSFRALASRHDPYSAPSRRHPRPRARTRTQLVRSAHSAAPARPEGQRSDEARVGGRRERGTRGNGGSNGMFGVSLCRTRAAYRVTPRGFNGRDSPVWVGRSPTVATRGRNPRLCASCSRLSRGVPSIKVLPESVGGIVGVPRIAGLAVPGTPANAPGMPVLAVTRTPERRPATGT